ncbi:MAG: tyrosine-type recombinase/integrase [Planctomycetes bacterium]|nr:tyrosine-type recombinase/integrase [Planctomycetota bacterium]
MLYPVIRMNDEKAILKFIRTSVYSPTTAKHYTWSLKRLARYLAHHRFHFEDLTGEMFLGFLDEQNWGLAMRAQAHTGARAFVKALFGSDHPFMELRVRTPKPRPQRTLTQDEITKLLAGQDLDTPKGMRDRALISLLIDTGLRAAEVCSLELGHLDVEKCFLQVKIKGGRWGGAVFSNDTAENLLDWLALRSEYALPTIKTVFVGIGGLTPGKQFTVSGLRSVWRRMSKKLGVKHFSTHAFRRSFATLTTQRGAPTRTVQIAGRWKDIRQVERYTQELPQTAILPYLGNMEADTDQTVLN